MACDAFSILETTACKKDPEPCTVRAIGISQLPEWSAALQHHLENVIPELKTLKPVNFIF